MNYINSVENKVFKEIASLKNKKYRYLNKCYLVEGVKFVQESIKCCSKIRYIIVSESKFDDLDEKFKFDSLNLEIIIFSKNLFSKIKQTENDQGIIACLEMEDNYQNFDFEKGIYFLIDKIQDPGNLGTIIRTAVAVGALGVIIVKGTVDLYNDKVLRSTMGAIFKINIYFVDGYFFLNNFLKNDFKIVIADSHSNNIYFNENLTGKIILVVGNEGSGISSELKKFNCTDVCIPMSSDLESLNVAQALSIIAFEYVRQSQFK